jgi:hypothetical protein
VSPQTALKVILSRPHPNTVTVQSCMCELKYIHLLEVHGPLITAQSAWKQFRFLPHRLSWKGTLTEYSTFEEPILYVWIGIWSSKDHLWTWVTWSGCQQFSSAFSGYHMDSWYSGVTHAVQSCTCELAQDHIVGVWSSVWYAWIRLILHAGHLTVQKGKDTYCNKDMCQASKRPSTYLGYDISFSGELLQNYMAVKHGETT